MHGQVSPVADFTRRTVTTTRVEYALPTPTNWAEIGKLTAAIQQEIGDEQSGSDDVVTVDAFDEVLVFSFELSKDVDPRG